MYVLKYQITIDKPHFDFNNLLKNLIKEHSTPAFKRIKWNMDSNVLDEIKKSEILQSINLELRVLSKRVKQRELEKLRMFDALREEAAAAAQKDEEDEINEEEEEQQQEEMEVDQEETDSDEEYARILDDLDAQYQADPVNHFRFNVYYHGDKVSEALNIEGVEYTKYLQEKKRLKQAVMLQGDSWDDEL